MAGRILWLALALTVAVPAGASASVLYVGDSLGVGTSPYLRQQLDGVAISVDAEIGRPSAAGVDVLRSEIGPEHDAVVFDLGTNDDPAAPQVLADDLAAARAIAGDRCLVIATLNRPPLNGVSVNGLNRAVTSFASGDPNVQLVDWRAAVADDPGMLTDGVHATGEGYSLRANLFAEAISSCLSVSGFEASGASSGGEPPLEHETGDLPPAASAGRNTNTGRKPDREPRESERDRRVQALATEVGRAVATGAEFG
jgi:hypothetical protein